MNHATLGLFVKSSKVIRDLCVENRPNCKSKFTKNLAISPCSWEKYHINDPVVLLNFWQNLSEFFFCKFGQSGSDALFPRIAHWKGKLSVNMIGFGLFHMSQEFRRLGTLMRNSNRLVLWCFHCAFKAWKSYGFATAWEWVNNTFSLAGKLYLKK